MGVKTQSRALGMWWTHQKDDDGVFDDPFCYLLPKLLSSKQIFVDCLVLLRQKLFLEVIVIEVIHGP